MKPKTNIWYVIGKKDESSPYGYKQITPKGQFFITLKESEAALEKFRNNVGYYTYGKEYVILKRTCTVLK